MFIGLSVIVIIFSSLPINAFAQTNDDYVTFGKSIYGVSIKHPTDWHVDEGSDRSTRDNRVGYDITRHYVPIPLWSIRTKRSCQISSNVQE